MLLLLILLFVIFLKKLEKEIEFEFEINKSIFVPLELNSDVSQVISNAEVRISEQINRQIETVENRFQSINAEIERKILNASQTLDESLNGIDNTLSNILEDQKLVKTKIITVARKIIIFIL